MNARQIYIAIDNGDEQQQKRALLELLAKVQIASEAILELNGYLRLRDGKEPLMLRSKMILGEFTDLSK